MELARPSLVELEQSTVACVFVLDLRGSQTNGKGSAVAWRTACTALGRMPRGRNNDVEVDCFR